MIITYISQIFQIGKRCVQKQCDTCYNQSILCNTVCIITVRGRLNNTMHALCPFSFL